jgi:hypothetical protein
MERNDVFALENLNEIQDVMNQKMNSIFSKKNSDFINEILSTLKVEFATFNNNLSPDDFEDEDEYVELVEDFIFNFSCELVNRDLGDFDENLYSELNILLVKVQSEAILISGNDLSELFKILLKSFVKFNLKIGIEEEEDLKFVRETTVQMKMTIALTESNPNKLIPRSNIDVNIYEILLTKCIAKKYLNYSMESEDWKKRWLFKAFDFGPKEFFKVEKAIWNNSARKFGHFLSFIKFELTMESGRSKQLTAEEKRSFDTKFEEWVKENFCFKGLDIISKTKLCENIFREVRRKEYHQYFYLSSEANDVKVT